MTRNLLVGMSWCLIGLLPLPASAEVLTGEVACGALSAVGSGVDHGPYDYRHPPRATKDIVESHHFTRKVEMLKGGQSGTVIGSDLDFTLRHFPNHVRALAAMVELARRKKTDHPVGARYPMDCWFDRAVRFTPDDIQVRLLYGDWLAKRGERTLALEQLDRVRDEPDKTPNMSYNLGLAYCEAKEFDKALEAAHQAYSEGFDLPGLRSRLQRAGKWKEQQPVEKPAAGDAAAAPTDAGPKEN